MFTWQTPCSGLSIRRFPPIKLADRFTLQVRRGMNPAVVAFALGFFPTEATPAPTATWGLINMPSAPSV